MGKDAYWRNIPVSVSDLNSDFDSERSVVHSIWMDLDSRIKIYIMYGLVSLIET